jgi:hypothetical protein
MLFGDALSTITAKDIEAGLEGLTVEQVGLLHGFGFWVLNFWGEMEGWALAEKRLFVQDYHDIFLPYIEQIDAQKLGSMYATRMVVFLRSEGILTPLAIDLSLLLA